MRLPFGLEIRKVSERRASRGSQRGEPPRWKQTQFRPGRTYSRQSWEEPLSGVKDLVVPLSERVDYAVYRALREGVPVIDAAIRELKRLVGTVKIRAEKPLKGEIEDFLGRLRILGSRQVGFQNFLALHLDSLLLFGKAAAEIVLSNARNDIYGLKPIPTETLRLIPGEDGELRLAQAQPLAQEPVLLPEKLAFYNVLSPQDNRPHGTSLLASMTFVADIWLRMAWSLGKTWERFGTPTFHVNWEPDPEFRDATGEQTKQVLEQIESQFVDAMESRKDISSTKDFFSAGRVRVEVVGGNGEVLDFQVPHRAIMEQIVGITGLPPWWLGFSWSTTERLSQQQADKIVGNIKSWREELTPDIKHLIDLWLRLRGRGTDEWELAWSQVSLMDRSETALADWREAITEARKWQTAKDLWRNGVINQLEAARLVLPELQTLAEEKETPEPESQAPSGQALPQTPSPEGRA